MDGADGVLELTTLRQHLMESSKTCPTNIELRLTQYNIIFKFPDHIPIHCLIHVLQYLLYILTSYAFHTAMWCANFFHNTYDNAREDIIENQSAQLDES